jgi:hypothetical protein
MPRRWCEAKACKVSKAAHERGYGTLDEILPVPIKTARPMSALRQETRAEKELRRR